MHARQLDKTYSQLDCGATSRALAGSLSVPACGSAGRVGRRRRPRSHVDDRHVGHTLTHDMCGVRYHTGEHRHRGALVEGWRHPDHQGSGIGQPGQWDGRQHLLQRGTVLHEEYANSLSGPRSMDDLVERARSGAARHGATQVTDGSKGWIQAKPVLPFLTTRHLE